MQLRVFEKRNCPTLVNEIRYLLLIGKRHPAIAFSFCYATLKIYCL